MKITEPLSRKVLTTIDAGLCSGLGSPKPGEMCILAAKRFSMGLSHGDALEGLPIGAAVRKLDIPLNDSNWSSNEARAKGMRRLAIAEFGSDEIDQLEFSKRVALKTIQRIVPVALRAAAMKSNAKNAAELLKQALLCEGATDLAAASRAASYAASAANDASRAASYAASAANYASYAASYAASAASYAASYAASGAASAASYASYAASGAASDAVLTMLADIAVEALSELDCPGCKFLYLCEKAT